MDKVKMKLTNPHTEPFTHADFVERDEKGVLRTDKNGNYKYKEFKTGDLLEVSPETAAHLEMTGQAERVGK